MMLWRLALVVYALLNVILTLFFKRMLSRRIHNTAMVWLFSIALSLSLNFLVALLIISVYIRQFNF